MDFVVVLVVLALVVLFVSGPLRRVARGPEQEPAVGAEGELPADSQLGELEAARDAKYREIRDAELDHRTGKLSDADYEAIDGALRAEAIEILRELDRLGERSSPVSAVPSSTR